jgi:hypothetical protein
LLFPLGLVCALACTSKEEMPPMLGDTDGSVPPSPGGGGGGFPDAGETDAAAGDATTSDAGTTLASASYPQGIFVTGGFVYYTNYASGTGDGTVAVVAAGGGTPTELTTGLSGPWSVLVSNGVVYFTLAPTAGTGAVMSVPTGGGTVTTILGNVTGAVGLAADTARIYWTLDSAGGGVVVDTLSVLGGVPTQILDFGGDLSPTSLAVAGSDVYVGSLGTQAAVLWGSTSGATNLTPLDVQASATFSDVAVGSNAVYATFDDVAPNGAILSYPRQGGVATVVAGNLDRPRRLALDGSNLYFTDPNGGNVWVKDLTTTDAPTVFASGLDAPVPIAVADGVYVGTANAIVRFPKL